MIDGVGLSGHDDHTDKETADLRMLAPQTKRAALVMYRLTQSPARPQPYVILSERSPPSRMTCFYSRARRNHLTVGDNPHAVARRSIDVRETSEFSERGQHRDLAPEPEARQPSVLSARTRQSRGGMNVAAST